MIEERGGWFVVNVKETEWFENSAFGKMCRFEDGENRFPQVGVRIYVLEPGKSNCRYHRESAQEDFLVLAGRPKLLANGEERQLAPWDFIHCPAGVSHVFVGAGDGPSAILMIGHRSPDAELFYPAHRPARHYGAEAPEPTPDPRVAYSDVPDWKPADPPPWPVGGRRP